MLDTYWWLSFIAHADGMELDQDLLFELGATGTEEEEAAEGSGPRLKAYFQERRAFAQAVARFRERAGFASGEAPVEDWDRSWRDRQTPLEVTPALTVAPPWVAFDPEDRPRHVIRLEAKMAFGTGSHETTRIAAALLESAGVAGRTVLDVGTGTGILALYAALLGARTVTACDIDPVVAGNLRENLGLNPPPPACRFLTYIGELSALSPDARFDVIICNMIRTELWPFRDRLLDSLSGDGLLIVSGQREEDKPHFLAWQPAARFRFAAEMSLSGWWGFAARKTAR